MSDRSRPLPGALPAKDRDADLAGNVEAVIAGVVSGWVVDHTQPGSPCRVEVYVNGLRVGEFSADRERPDLAESAPGDNRAGFAVDMGDAWRPGDQVDVHLAGTNIRLPALPEMAGPPIEPREYARVAANPFVPVPPAEFVRHVYGAADGDFAQPYRVSGALAAADVYNNLLAAGCPLDTADFHLVEIGCGCGRVAAFLAPFLRHGRYSGFDVWSSGVDWAREHITKSAPNLEFAALSDAQTGYQGRRSFPLPLDDASADALFANSLFTHLDAAAMRGYLAEIERVLRPGAALYLTCFLREPGDEERLRAAAASVGEFVSEEGVSWIGNGDYLDSRVDLDFLVAAVEQAGMQVLRVRRGFWREPQRSTLNVAAFQDLVVARRLPADDTPAIGTTE